MTVEVAGESVLSCNQANQINSSDWICDSGCTHHLTNDERLIIDPQPSSLKLRTANNSFTYAKWKGPAILNLKDGQKVKLSEVHYVPNLQSNLLSITCLNYNHLDVLFGKEIVIKDRVTGTELVKAVRKGRLPVLECLPGHDETTSKEEYAISFHVKIVERSLNDWHTALGHASKRYIVQLASQLGDDEMRVTRVVNDIKEPCIECARGKQRRNIQPDSDTGTSAPTHEPGAVICADLLGPISPMDRHKNRFVAVYVDHNTKFKAIALLKRKSDQPQQFIDFKTKIEKQFGVVVKVLRSDGGGEFISGTLDAYLRANGIRKQTTEANTSASNGEAENTIRVLSNARTMMMGCDAPTNMWGFAFEYSAYIRNRLPCKGNDGWISPLEALTGVKPKVSHILPFGSYCTVYQAPKSKGITTRAEIGIILGVSDEVKGYHVLLPEFNKFIITRDVQNITPPLPRHNSFDFKIGRDSSPISNIDHPNRAGSYQKSGISNPKLDFIIRTRKQRAEEIRKGMDEANLALAASFLADEIYHSVYMTIVEPKTIREAQNGPQAEEWRQSMLDEINGIIANGTLEIVERPIGVNVVSHKWVFKIKYDKNHNIEKFKSRMVARGFTQIYGVDYSETFAPVIKHVSVRLIFTLSAVYKCDIRHLDFPQAYLNAKLDKPIYIELPEILKVDSKKYVGLLLKSLYGLKQSGRLWHEEADQALINLGLIRSQLDPCLYFCWTNGQFTLCGLYVDDLLLFSQDDDKLDQIIQSLVAKYNVKDLGLVRKCLGINVHKIPNGYFLEQSDMIEELLLKHGLSASRSQSTPINIDHGYFEDGPESTMTLKEMQEIVGSQIWISNMTRPDISLATNLAARYMSKANENHLEYCKLTGGPVDWTYYTQYPTATVYKAREDDLPMSLVKTEIQATIEDVVAIFTTTTTSETRQIRVANLTLPTAQDPHFYQCLNWALTDNTLKGVIVKLRDWSFIEHDQDVIFEGRRAWIRIMKHVEIPGVIDLEPKYGTIRGEYVHNGFLYIETDRPGVLELVAVYHVKPNGQLNSPIGEFFVSKALAGHYRAIKDTERFVRMLKLSQLYYLDPSRLQPLHSRSKCELCVKVFSRTSKKTNCRHCGKVICTSGCSDEVTLLKAGLQVKVRVCITCCKAAHALPLQRFYLERSEPTPTWISSNESHMTMSDVSLNDNFSSYTGVSIHPTSSNGMIMLESSPSHIERVKQTPSHRAPFGRYTPRR
ncbi:hypothetical protein LEN26_000680 [Aphanomyces euteiches]|nr:hypothetical protein LEN26_000680 [Aphanomyces euteiches]